MAGISGPDILFIIDEASGVPEDIFEAIEGNRAAGADVILCSNPTQTSGTFFDAFHSKRDLWHPLTISSEETPNVETWYARLRDRPAYREAVMIPFGEMKGRLAY